MMVPAVVRGGEVTFGAVMDSMKGGARFHCWV
jgi:hypothetical protein